MKEEEKKKTTKKATTGTKKKTTTTKKTSASAKKNTNKKATVKKKDLPKKANSTKKAPVKKNTTTKKTSTKTSKGTTKKTTTGTKKKNIKKKDLPKIKTTAKIPVKEIIPVEQKKEYSEEDTRTYKILSYIGILWIIGIFVPCKDDKSLKFHVGQGIILNIFEIGLSIIVSLINNLIIDNVFKTQVSFYGIETGVYKTSILGLTISGILNLLVAAFAITYVIIGVLNASNDKNKKLPIIGKLSFYK